MSDIDNARRLFLEGLESFDRHDLETSERCFRAALALAPHSVPVLTNLSVSLLARHEFDEALAIAGRAIAGDAGNVVALSVLANCHIRAGRFADALDACDRIIAVEPNSCEAHNHRGVALAHLARADEALASYERAIALDPAYGEAHINRGNALRHAGSYAAALDSYERALQAAPGQPSAWLARGNVLVDLDRHDDALAAYDCALALAPDLENAWIGRGNVLNRLGRHAEALAAYDRALERNPGLAAAWLGRGNGHLALGRHDEALAAYDQAQALKPDLAEASIGRGGVFAALQRYPEASAAYDKALALAPDLAAGWLGRGNVLFDLKRRDEALAAYDKALALAPDLQDAWIGRGNVLNQLRRHEESAKAFAEALRINSQHPFAKGLLLYQRILSCDWHRIDALIAEIHDDVEAGKPSAEPFGWQGVARSPRNLQLCAEIYNRHKFPARNPMAGGKPWPGHRRIRIGYASGELREQATSHLLVGLLERHDKDRFDVYGIDNGWDDGSRIRRRIVAALRGLVDVRQLGDAAAAAAIRDSEIDILVNLNGYFGEERTGVFAHRPAPIQVNYLGFPGTIGAPYIDYIVADRHVIPPEHRQFYSEKVVHLPGCYQANDRNREIGARIFSRAECALPETGFVFCCFNNNYKILPATFDAWMRIVRQVEHSVLWLLADNAPAQRNLKAEAAARGVDPQRLVFAGRMPPAEHLARHRVADLFVDTLPYNAHTTASDALWAGLPVLTLPGGTFPGRVAASLLTAVGLPELVAATPDEYERMAIDLATHPDRMATIRRQLDRNRLTAPLFDTAAFTRHLEAAYTAMYERHRAGLAPDHMVVPT